MFYLVLLFAAAALLSGGRSSNVNRHMKLLELDNNVLNMQSKQATKKFVALIKKPNAVSFHSTGAPLELTCEAVGTPAPSIHWFKNDAPVYEVSCPKKPYTDLSERSKLLPFAPRILVTYKVLVDCIGCNVVLPCRARGHPRPKFSWRDNTGRPVGNDPRMKVLRSGELIISTLLWTDLGEFTCRATNMFGSTLATTFVYPARMRRLIELYGCPREDHIPNNIYNLFCSSLNDRIA
ncbi:Neural/ectodermal development factor IMP-L2 [Papilio machaon]|uniref:Neural/ectodermal development factor IMP-L2 n=1 Tax=Papilio machaon TaxID=76193 RepID=A0A0N1IGP5_PAPMA|nr:Neural/ectodermal development factor IMP-L2 [Papilio machaon]